MNLLQGLRERLEAANARLERDDSPEATAGGDHEKNQSEAETAKPVDFEDNDE